MNTQTNLNFTSPLKTISNNENNSLNNKSSPNIPHEVFVNRIFYQFKIILIGDSGVGKTSLVNRFMGFEFKDNYACTINADFKLKSISIDPSTRVELTVWDTCGQERFRAMTRQYFKDANGVVLVFDVNEEKSFKGLSSWLTEIKNNCNNSDISIVLIGNKIDLNERKITKEEGNQFALKNCIKYIETSSKEGINIDAPFESLVNDIIRSIKVNRDNIGNETIEQKLQKLGEKNEIERKSDKEVKCC